MYCASCTPSTQLSRPILPHFLYTVLFKAYGSSVAGRYNCALMPLTICFVASEVAPLAKTGGLADVAGALPRRLHALGHEVRVFMPLYSTLNRGGITFTAVESVRDVPVTLGAFTYIFSLVEARTPAGLTIYLIDCPALYQRASLYTSDADEHLRFLLLQRAVFESCQRLKFAPQILHCNDWHTALMPLLLKHMYSWDRLFAQTRTVLSIHNIGYQGEFPATTIGHLGLVDPLPKLAANDVNRGRIVWLGEGIRWADRVSTVSPTYAKEITTPNGGWGLDETLKARIDGVSGILNGVDYQEWNPQIDTLLPARYTPSDLSGKTRSKQALLNRLRLTVDLPSPLIGIVSRLTPQKGFDLLFDCLPDLLQQREFALAVLGSGDPAYENFFRGLQRRFPERVAFQQGYNEELAHWIEAGSDMFLMPSMYEPCGLNQMYSLKYGSVPIVRRTGGLADSVHMWDATTRQGTGIVFNDFDVPAIRWALHTALDIYKDRDAWRQLMANGMSKDYSWEHQAAEYVQLYEQMIA